MGETMFSKRRTIIIVSAIAIAFASAGLRAFQVQVIESPVYAAAADKQQLTPIRSHASRGNIYDRNGDLLAVSKRAFLIRIHPTTAQDSQLVSTLVAPALGRSSEEIKNRVDEIIRSGKTPPSTVNSVLAYNVAPEVKQQIDDAFKQQFKTQPKLQDPYLHGVLIEENWSRRYPFGTAGGPTLGFVNLEPQGYAGIEAYYNGELKDIVGTRIRKSEMELVNSTPTLAGADLVLTIDINMQTYIEKRLTRAIQETRSVGGTIIVMDTKSGAVLASASAPGFDPNRAMILAADPKTLKFLHDPAVSSAYEPGSVIKLLTFAGALDSGIISPDTVFYDSGQIVVEGKTIKNSDRQANGRVDVAMTLGKSINVATVQAAQQLGAEKFYNYFQKFGIGSRTGIDLGAEAPGVLRTTEDSEWSKVDLATNSFGQGMSATPFQVVNAVNAIANDGWLLQPYVVQAWRTADGSVISKKPTRKHQVISTETARTMRKLMTWATDYATPEVNWKGYTVAGKTGTADWYLRGIKQDSTIVTYVGMLPADEPRLTILVKLDQPSTSRWAKAVTIPVFSDVAKKAVEILGVPPSLENRK
jgi:cell division protein FtsI/penicillin-binding protein 2